MQLVTLDQIETDARLYADQRTTSGASAQFISQPEARRLINKQCKRLYGLCVAARPEHYAIDLCGPLNTLGACMKGRRVFIPMPKCPPFYELLGVEIVWTPTNIEPIEEIRAADAYRYEMAAMVWGQWTAKGYVQGGQQDGSQGFFVAPGPAAVDGTVLRCRYIPAWQDLGVRTCKDCDNDSFDAVNGWDELVALAVAIKMLKIMKADYRALQEDYLEVKSEIETMARERNAQEPLEIRDVEPRFGQRFRWPRLPPAP